MTMYVARSEPLAWPVISEPLSFSTLLALRACARRWAYSHARFDPGGLFDAKGRLLERATWGAVRGRAVHRSLEQLLDIHQQQGGPAAGSWSLLQFWKHHLPSGGVPAIVVAALDEELAVADRSLRNRSLMPWMRQCAVRDIGELTAAVNSKLALALKAGTLPRGEGLPSPRRQLWDGTYAEVIVEAPLGHQRSRLWRGIIDVARISADEVVLIDYKGGAEQLTHREQLELYALLYARDQVVNPSRRLATQLTLAYDKGRMIAWPAPDATKLAELEVRIADEIEALIRSSGTRPPEARPSVDSCGLCTARGLCDAYWNAPIPSTDDFFDLEISVESSSVAGDELVGAPNNSSRPDGIGNLVRVLVPANQREQARKILPKQRIRLLGASAGPVDPESNVTVVVLGQFAEVVALSGA